MQDVRELGLLDLVRDIVRTADKMMECSLLLSEKVEENTVDKGTDVVAWEKGVPVYEPAAMTYVMLPQETIKTAA